MCDDLKHAIMKMLISKTSLGLWENLGISKDKNAVTLLTIKRKVYKWCFLAFVMIQNVSELNAKQKTKN